MHWFDAAIGWFIFMPFLAVFLQSIYQWQLFRFAPYWVVLPFLAAAWVVPPGLFLFLGDRCADRAQGRR